MVFEFRAYQSISLQFKGIWFDNLILKDSFDPTYRVSFVDGVLKF